MSFLNLLKSTPVKLTIGTVGVAGASVFALKALGKGGWNDVEEKPISGKYLLSERSLKDRFADGLRQDDSNIFSGTSNTHLNLRTFNCAPSFFPGVKWPEKINNPTDYPSFSKVSTNPDFKFKPSIKKSSDTQACLTMHLIRKPKQKLLFRSELTLKNESVGIALWTVFKSLLEGHSADKGPYYYLFFLEKGNAIGKESWSIKKGFFWGGDSSISIQKALTIQSPDAPHSFSKKLRSGGTKEIDASYSGIWTENGGDEKPLFLEDKKFQFRSESPFTPTTLHTVVDTPSFGFCGESCLSTGKDFFDWTMLSNPPLSETQKEEIKKTINDWYEPFKEKKGKWKTLNEHCKSKSEASQDSGGDNSNDPCFMFIPDPKTQSLPA